MFISDCLDVNQLGHLTIGGYDTVELAQSYGTPLYVMDEVQIRENCRKYVNSIRNYYKGNGMALYASKAFSCKAIYKIVQQEQMGVDVVSGGELYTAKAAGFPAERIVFHGNNKTPEELVMAVEYGVRRIVVDNLSELELLNEIAASADKTVDILFRIKPGIDAHTHDFVKTGQIDSKFGFALETGEAMNAVKAAIAQPHINLKGVHCHIGSQIFDIDPFEHAAEVMMGFIADIKRECGYEIEELNLGGGFGIKYLPENNPVPYDSYMEKVSKVVYACCDRLGVKVPFIYVEPGRSIVGAAGITLYTVGAIKEIPNIRTYISVDGGMTDNPRYILYKSEYDAVIANKADQPRSKTVTIAGKCCESGDLIGEGMRIQQPAPGDILAVLATGAYNYSMASNYNRIPRPPVVMVNEKGPRLVVKRESFENLIANDLD